jgi:putative transposase
LGLARSSFYYEPAEVPLEDIQTMQQIDKIYLKFPFFGSRRIAQELSLSGLAVNRKRVQRLMRNMGIEAIYPRRRTTIASPQHRVYPYLLKDMKIKRANHVWCSDITYIMIETGVMYLVAVMDWYSRYVLSWELSNSLDASFCVTALEESLRHHRPLIFNTDQGSQFTSQEFTGVLQEQGVAISMDGRGRALDNVFIERLWRTVKYEDVHLKYYSTGDDLYNGLTNYFEFYNDRRRHQSLNQLTPRQVFEKSLAQQKTGNRTRFSIA